MMHPATANLLRRQKALAEHARAHPTDSDGIRQRREELARAGAMWVDAGYPDAPKEPKPAAQVLGCKR